MSQTTHCDALTVRVTWVLEVWARMQVRNSSRASMHLGRELTRMRQLSPLPPLTGRNLASRVVPQRCTGRRRG